MSPINKWFSLAEVVWFSFVGTIPHPLLFTPGNSRFIDVQYDPETGDQKVVRGLLVKRYLSVAPSKGVAVSNQPAKQVIPPSA